LSGSTSPTTRGRRKNEMRRLTPDLYIDPFYQFMERTNLYWQIGMGLTLLLLGGWSWVIWGMFVRVVFTIHVTGLVNSVGHHFGYQTYRTGDESRNKLVGRAAHVGRRAGTTTTTPSQPRRATVCAGTNSIPPGSPSARSKALGLAKSVHVPTPEALARGAEAAT